MVNNEIQIVMLKKKYSIDKQESESDDIQEKQNVQSNYKEKLAYYIMYNHLTCSIFKRTQLMLNFIITFKFYKFIINNKVTSIQKMFKQPLDIVREQIFEINLKMHSVSDYRKNFECPVIGIDLGTTYSCVGIYQNGAVEIIANERGNRKIPSVVAFTDEETLIGEAAQYQGTVNPSRTLYDVKRLIGKRYNDKTLQYDKKLMTYEIVNKDSKPYIKVSNIKGYANKSFAPEEISAIVLKKLKEIAESYLGTKVTNAVITVPAYFNEAQRQASKDAGTISGLNVVRVINEPTAAAIAYGFDNLEGEKNMLVFDLGGCTFDVSILTIDNGVFEVIAIAGDQHIGGKDFDQRVIDHFINEINKKYDKDISGDKRAILKLKRQVEQAKIKLQYRQKANIIINDLFPGVNLEEELTRTKFEELNDDLFQRIYGYIQITIDDSGLKTNQIDEVILGGGSSQIPKIKEIVKDFFNGKQPNTRINPDEVVCYGAAIYGESICKQKYIQHGFGPEFTTLSLGIEISGGVMTKIIPKGQILPAKQSCDFTTLQDNQESFTVSVYAGERTLVKDNHFLEKFELTGIPRQLRGSPLIEVAFEIDDNGVLKVSAMDVETGNINQIVISYYSGTLSIGENYKMLREAEEFAEQDKVIREIIDAQNSLESYTYSIKSQLQVLEQQDKNFSDEDISTINDALKGSQDRLDKNQNTQKEDYVLEIQELEKICNPILSRTNYQYNVQKRLFIKNQYYSDL
ncbi:hypothetical protein pb186bvf_002297 [Paramecium bursaria]